MSALEEIDRITIIPHFDKYEGIQASLSFTNLEFYLHVGREAKVALFVTRVSLCEFSPNPTSYDPFNGDHITPANNTDSVIVCVCLNKGRVDA